MKPYESGSLATGTVEVVRIMNGRTTQGALVFDKVNQEGGTVIVVAEVDLNDPLELELSGARNEILNGEEMAVYADTGYSEDDNVYLWYLNGENVGSGEIFTTPADHPTGFYLLDCTVFTADGTRAAHTGVQFTVTDLISFSGRTRSVSAVSGTPNVADPAGFENFNAAAVSTLTNSSGTYTAEASQTSAPAPDGITVLEKADETGPFYALEDHSQEAASRFLVRFLLSRRSEVTLSGEMSILLDDGGTNIGRYGSTVVLSAVESGGETVVFTESTKRSYSIPENTR